MSDCTYLLEHYLIDSIFRKLASDHGTVIDSNDRGATAKELEDLLEASRSYGREVAIAAKDKQIAELEKDRARLEFVISRGAIVQVKGDPAYAYRLDYAAIGDYPGWLETAYHDNWRDAIDEAMAEQGDTCTEAKE